MSGFIERLGERVGIITSRHRDYVVLLDTIEQTGVIDVLQDHAARLQDERDKTEVVYERKMDLARFVDVELRWDLKTRDSVRLSRGVSMEANGRDPIFTHIRFTDSRFGGQWNYLQNVGGYLMSTIDPNPVEYQILTGRMPGTIEQKIDLAMKLATPIQDWSHKNGSSGKLSNGYRVLQPK